MPLPRRYGRLLTLTPFLPNQSPPPSLNNQREARNARLRSITPQTKVQWWESYDVTPLLERVLCTIAPRFAPKQRPQAQIVDQALVFAPGQDPEVCSVFWRAWLFETLHQVVTLLTYQLGSEELRRTRLEICAKRMEASETRELRLKRIDEGDLTLEWDGFAEPDSLILSNDLFFAYAERLGLALLITNEVESREYATAEAATFLRPQPRGQS